jgi:hypothetical protein
MLSIFNIVALRDGVSRDIFSTEGHAGRDLLNNDVLTKAKKVAFGTVCKYSIIG